ncbi:MAG: 4Fe-4S dicluster domain-containing protein [Bryobacterales bacterium]|jgi:anaerobic dimethyl sulfoxide reductase subunit B|nr:4Fe-4S dicluster domain-containing protein [Bryobacterales bacterium]
MVRYGWLFDQKKCIECRACEAACKQWNGVETGAHIRYRLVRTYESGVFPNVERQALSLACQHCADATCIKACPVKAIWRRDDGIVLVNTDKCVGCGMCVKFCPYGAPQLHPATRIMEKCTMCVDRVDQNLEPACSTICPTGALQWGEWDQIQGQGVDRIENFSTPILTRPAMRFVDKGW